jgi:mono/diheme cytochrome c family protein
MRFKKLLLAITAVFTLILLSAVTMPPQGLAMDTQQITSNSGPGNDDDWNGSPIEGRRIFVRENCAYCHGGFAGGLMCPSLREDRPDESDVRDVIEEGTENGMPPYPHLDNERDIRNLAAYFQSIRTRREPTFTHWWEPIPTQ